MTLKLSKSTPVPHCSMAMKLSKSTPGPKSSNYHCTVGSTLRGSKSTPVDYLAPYTRTLRSTVNNIIITDWRVHAQAQPEPVRWPEWSLPIVKLRPTTTPCDLGCDFETFKVYPDITPRGTGTELYGAFLLRHTVETTQFTLSWVTIVAHITATPPPVYMHTYW